MKRCMAFRGGNTFLRSLTKNWRIVKIPSMSNQLPLSKIINVFQEQISFVSVFADFVDQALNSPDDTDSNSSVLNQILAAQDVDIRDKIVTLIDLVAAGIETVYTIFE